MNSGQSYKHILKYTGLFGSIQVLTVLTSILRNKAAAVFIDRYGQGVSELFNSTINLISTATTLIVPVSIVRRLSYLFENFGTDSTTFREELRTIRSIGICTGLVGMFITILFSPVINRLTFGHTVYQNGFILLSPMLLMLSINGTEIAILKSTRMLKQLVTVSLVGSVSTMVICVASYYFWRLKGIVISLDVSLFAVTLLNLRYTCRAYSYRVRPFCLRILLRGKGLVRLSLAFLLAAVVASFVEILIRAFISNSGTIENVGLYGAGFVLTVTYTKFIFSAMDADFYPRLSGTCDSPALMNTLINRQVVVCVQLIVPCLLLFNLFLPLVISVLYTEKYFEIIPMVMFASFYMFCKALITPVAYIPLAKSDSQMFLLMESISAALMGVFVIAGYHVMELTGCGIGLSLSHIVETYIILVLYRRHYSISLNRKTVSVALVQLVLLAAGVATTFLLSGFGKYSVVIVMSLVSILVSYNVFIKTKDSEPC